MRGPTIPPGRDHLVIWAVKLPTRMGGSLALLAGFPRTVEEGTRRAQELDTLFRAEGWRHVVADRTRPPFRGMIWPS